MSYVETVIDKRSQWVEIVRIQLTAREAYGVRHCAGAMWEPYIGGLLRKAGHEFPYGQSEIGVTLDNQLVVKVPPDQMITTGLTVEQILVHYQRGTLAEHDDATLYTAISTLEQAEQHYFEGYDFTDMAAIELSQARERRHHYTKVVNAILKLLLVRYGCND